MPNRPSESGFRAAAIVETTLEKLGNLAQLPGTWMGTGFNLISLPANDGTPFKLKLNNTRETLSFTQIGGPIPNRGLSEKDIFYVGLHYLQQVSDAATNAGLHVETGMWLNMPSSKGAVPSIVRLATIPHGDAVLASGPIQADINGAPPIPPVDPTPFKLNPAPADPTKPPFTGVRRNLTDEVYLAPFKSPPKEFDPGIIKDPNQLLRSLLVGTIVKTTVLRVVANSVDTIGKDLQGNTDGNILNVPFVAQNAAATTIDATFWIEQFDTGILQLQYSQTVILDFAGIKWPHISVATLVKQ